MSSPPTSSPPAAAGRLDVTDRRAWCELDAELEESDGQVHGLVNNAGITWRARFG